MNINLKITATSILAAFALAGCGTNTDDTPVTTGTLSSQAGKPGAPVSLMYAVPQSKSLGASIDIDLTVRFDSAVDTAEISVSSTDGLELVQTPKLALGAQKAGASHKMTVSVIPYESGLRFVNVFAVTQQGRQQLRRSFAVPVAGGGDSTPQKQMPDSKVMPNGENVISLPAEESGN